MMRRPPRSTLFPYTNALPICLAVAIKISTQEEWVHVKRDFVLVAERTIGDRKSTRLNSSHLGISYAVFCLKKKKNENIYKADDAKHRHNAADTGAVH